MEKKELVICRSHSVERLVSEANEGGRSPVKLLKDISLKLPCIRHFKTKISQSLVKNKIKKKRESSVRFRKIV